MNLSNQIFLLSLLFTFGCASRIVFPPGIPEFNTPVMTNGFVGGIPSNFSITANISLQGYAGCDPYEAQGLIVVVNIGPCNIDVKVRRAIEAGAIGVMIHAYEPPGIGRKSRAPLSDTPLNFPAVTISFGDFLMLVEMIETTHIVIEMTPGISDWHTLIFDTAWFIVLNVAFLVCYALLLALVIRKLVLKVQHSGFTLNISFVYLFFQGIFCILMLVRWIDPLVGRGIFIIEMDSFFDLFPSSVAFTALLLMAFFWFEVINQFADMKVSPFLSKKLQIPFWIAAGIILLLPMANLVVLTQSPIIAPFLAIGAVIMVGGIIVAAFYIVVAVKVLKVLERSRRLNIDKKSRVRNLAKIRVSIILSCIIACIYPIASFVLRYFGLFTNSYLYFAILLEESFLLALILFVQVWSMPHKRGRSPSTSKPVQKTTENGTSVAGNAETSETSSNHV